MAILAFFLFAILFCHLMNKWSQELEQLDYQAESSSNPTSGGTYL